MQESNKSILLPHNLLLLISFSYITFGEAIYIVRDLIFWNTQGSPFLPAIELNFYFLLFTVNSAYINKRYEMKYPVNTFDQYELRNGAVLFLVICSLVGLFLMSNGFTQLPLFSGNIVESRHNKEHGAGEGLGFVLMLCAVWLMLFYMRDFYRTRKIVNLIKILPLSIILLSPGGRSLLILPIYLFVVFGFREKKNKSWMLFGLIPGSFLFLIIMELIGVFREYGSIDFEDTAQLNFMLSDFAPEFRSLVNFNELAPNNMGDKFAFNIISGNIPGAFFSILGLDKSEYFVETGSIVTSYSDYASHFQGGIRLSLLGEIFTCSLFVKIVIMVMYLLFVDFGIRSIFHSEGKCDIINQIFSYLLVFSIPYGFTFIMNAIQLYIFLFLFRNKIFLYNSVSLNSVTPITPK